MTKQTDQPRFIFHGNAMPLGGRITNLAGKALLDMIPGPPSAALTVAGGKSRATSRGSAYRDILQWGATVAESTGELTSNGHYITTVTSAVAKVQAKNDPFVFEADSIRITMVSDHVDLSQPTITPTETTFEGLRLDGQEINLELDKDLVECPTFGKYEERYRGSAGADATLPRTPGGFVPLSFVRRISWKKKKIEGNRLFLRGFGSIYFGEVLMNENNRRITMVRLDMGSSVKAAVACAEADPNGTWG